MKNQNRSQDQSVNKSRRKMAMTGLAVPVILSISSRPVWATPSNCSFIRALSGNLSLPGNTCTSTRASTISPGFYKENQSRWGELGCAYTPSKRFSELFTAHLVYIPAKTTGSPLYNRIDNPTLAQLFDYYPNIAEVGGTDTSIHDSCFHYIAAVLSASSSFLVYPYSESQIIADWAGSRSLETNIKAIQAGEYNVAKVASLLS